jgi:glycosyltransferase involved in cell wall biosynthesis
MISCVKPTVSVVIPTYNRFELTNAAINSVRCVDSFAVEIIVVDDFGLIPYCYEFSHNSYGILVRVIRAEVNGGPGMARQIGVANAYGDLIAFLDSDDVFDINWLNTILAEYKKIRTDELNVFFVGRAVGSSKIVRLIEWLLTLIPVPMHLNFLRFVFIISNCFHTPSIAISKASCYFGNNIRFCEDYYTNAIAIFQVDFFVRIENTACSLSRQQGSQGGESASKWRMFKGELRVRNMLFRSSLIPIQYRLLIPIGVLYQFVRVFSLTLLGYFSATRFARFLK